MYEYTLQYKRTEDHANADALSRLPPPEHPQSVPLPAETIFLVEFLESSPIKAVQIRSWTKRDPLLVQVVKFIKEGWPEECAEDIKPFSSIRLELSVEDDCILWEGMWCHRQAVHQSSKSFMKGTQGSPV